MKVPVGKRGKSEFSVGDQRGLDAMTRGFVAKSVTIAGLLIVIGAAAYFAFSGNTTELKTIVNSMTPLMFFVLGYYFRSSDSSRDAQNSRDAPD